MEETKLYSDPYDPEDESSSTPGASSQPSSLGSDHSRRVRTAFDSWHEAHREKVSKADEERMLGIRDAVEKRDTEKASKHLADTKEHSGWLYEELMKHPEISAIMQELSIMGL